MKVLFLMISYPNVSDTTNMYTDLAEEYFKNKHEVFVIAPGRNSTKFGLEGEINVLRVKTLNLFSRSIFVKGLANILLPFFYKNAIKKFINDVKFDLVILPTPPITFLNVALFFKEKYSSKIYLILRDIFPQNAKDLGLIKSDRIFNYFRKKEKLLYEISDYIGCMSQGNIDYVTNHNPEIDNKKLYLLPNWMKVSEFKPSEGKLRQKLGLSKKFIAIFGGNFGKPQQISFLIQVAEKLKEKEDIVFLLIGDGTEKNIIKERVLKEQLNNVIVMDILPRNDYMDLIKDCDVGLVNLSQYFTIPNIPSRALSYWAVKLPILAAIDKHTDFWKILENTKSGLWSLTGNIDQYISNLLFLYNNEPVRKEMGENGYLSLIHEFNVENTYKNMIKVIE